MDLLNKIRILADGAKYDVSCSSSGSAGASRGQGMGSTLSCGVCHSWSDDGRCISLLKILYSNECIYDCTYCVNRRTHDIPRASFTPQELARLTMEFYRRNYIEGLFLSSGVKGSPDRTMEELGSTLRLLREEYAFHGYIHVKAIPGADPKLLYRAGQYANRISVNMELPSEQGLKLLAPQKRKQDILRPMHFISQKIREEKEEKKIRRLPRLFAPAGQSTQLIIGATPDSDTRILKLSETLYQSFGLKRVYYSAYVPVNRDARLPDLMKPPLLREHRLYQADWLLRFYGFQAAEIAGGPEGNLDGELDPKCAWALQNIHLFPVEINKADYAMLLRVPGIGPVSARKILTARRCGPITYEGLKSLGAVVKRARYFITLRGKYYGEGSLEPLYLRSLLADRQEGRGPAGQLSLFGEEAAGTYLLPAGGGW
jgi:putative DNA modification/repair radical SAM protein